MYIHTYISLSTYVYVYVCIYIYIYICVSRGLARLFSDFSPVKIAPCVRHSQYIFIFNMMRKMCICLTRRILFVVRMEFPCVVLWRPEALDCRVLILPEAWN